jgi:hypothetical protein
MEALMGFSDTDAGDPEPSVTSTKESPCNHTGEGSLERPVRARRFDLARSVTAVAVAVSDKSEAKT